MTWMQRLCHRTWLMLPALVGWWLACATTPGESADDPTTSGTATAATAGTGGRGGQTSAGGLSDEGGGGNMMAGVGGSGAGSGGSAAAGGIGGNGGMGAGGGMGGDGGIGGGGTGGGGMGGMGGSGIVGPNCGGGGGGMGAGGVLQSMTLGPNLGLAVPDDGYDGTLGSMACIDIIVPSMAPDIVASVSVAVGLDHSWLGDMTVKLVSPSATVVTLVSRAGLTEASDDGGSGVGDSSNLDALFPLLYIDGAANDAENMGTTPALGTFDNICEDDGICTWNPNPGAAPAGSLTVFVGETSNGTWRLCAGDSVVDDPGILQNVTLHICK